MIRNFDCEPLHVKYPVSGGLESDKSTSVDPWPGATNGGVGDEMAGDQ